VQLRPAPLRSNRRRSKLCNLFISASEIRVTAYRRTAAAVGLILLFTASLPSAAQARLGMGAGITAPTGTYGDDKNIGYHLGLLLDVRVPNSPLGFRVDGEFHQLKYSTSATKLQIWSASANALLKLPTGTPLTPYLIGGAGIYNSRRLFLRTPSSTDPGVNLGGGLRFELRDLTTFVEARYHRVTGDNGIRLLPITVGILF
jgi:hypothetical protein